MRNYFIRIKNVSYLSSRIFAVLRCCIGLNNMCHFYYPISSITQTNSQSHANFSRALCQPRVFD